MLLERLRLHRPLASRAPCQSVQRLRTPFAPCAVLRLGHMLTDRRALGRLLSHGARYAPLQLAGSGGHPSNTHQNCKHRICWVLGRSLSSRFPAGMSFASLFAVQQISSRFPAIFEVAGSTSGRKHVQAQPRCLENVVPSGVSTYRRNEWPSRFPADLRLQQISSRFDAIYLMPA